MAAVGVMKVGATMVGAAAMPEEGGATDIKDMDTATPEAAIMPEAATLAVATASQAAGTMVVVAFTAAEVASMVAAASTAEVDFMVEAEAMVVGTGNPLLKRVRTAGSVALPAVLFLPRFFR